MLKEMRYPWKSNLPPFLETGCFPGFTIILLGVGNIFQIREFRIFRMLLDFQGIVYTLW